jgi:hypothetical protein
VSDMPEVGSIWERPMGSRVKVVAVSGEDVRYEWVRFYGRQPEPGELHVNQFKQLFYEVRDE